MLEVKHLKRIYRMKNAEPVYALNDVSLKFPETGLIFILGKSGSGKSTLLNVMGGLDEADDGEIIINGKSSKTFSKGEMDSYRNTYLGFIFQEYNILSDFTVKENIALAFQLQHKKATDEAIESILQDVDLGGYGKRKPNELSGGQKQRVAIARALVKEPTIIFADEPTGALDSNTGKQVFETLKKLSKDKLVVVVSHDRDFAEHFGDRVIELKDGKVISDITKTSMQSVMPREGLYLIGDNIIRLSKDRPLTEKDLPLINEAMKKGGTDVYISVDSHANEALREAAKIDREGNREEFIVTDPEKIVEGAEGFDAIKSKFSLKHAFRMGAKSLKVKPFRLVMTILLSTVSFSMFGASLTLSFFSAKSAVKSTIERNNISNVSVSISGKKSSPSFSDGVIDEIESKTGAKLYLPSGVSVPLNTVESNYNDNFHTYRLSASLEINDAMMEDFNLDLAYGNLPKSENECAISLYSYYTFEDFGIVKNASNVGSINSNEVTMDKVLGMELKDTVNTNEDGETPAYVVTGIIDTHVPSRLLQYRNKPSSVGFADSDYSSLMDLKSDYSIHNIFFVGKKGSGEESISLKYPFNCESEPYYGKMDARYRPSNDNTFYFDDSKHDLSTGEAIISADNCVSFFPKEVTEIESFSFGGACTSSRGDDFYYVNNIRRDDILKNSVFIAASYKTKYDKYQDFYANHLDIAKRINEGDDERCVNGYGIIPSYRYEDATNEQKYQLFEIYFDNYVVTDRYDVDVTSEYYRYYLEAAKAYEDAVKKQYPPLLLDALDDANRAFDAALNDYVDAHYEQIYSKYKNDNFFSYYESATTEKEKKRLVHDYLAYHVDGMQSEEAKEIRASFLPKKKQILRSLSSFPSLSICSSLPVGPQNNPSQEVWLKIVGLDLSANGRGCVFLSKDEITSLNQKLEENGFGNYDERKALIAFGENRKALDSFLDYYFSKKPTDYEKTPDGTWWLSFETRVASNVENISSIIAILTQVFLYVGIAFAIFSMLLFYNFISISINNKKREIGILRAVGAKRSDVFKIFYSEAFMIATINFVLSAVIVFVLSLVANQKFTESIYFDFTIMNPNALVVLALLAISLFASFISSLLPVTRIANKKPIDAIQNR